jgi:hypothetical protein
MKYLKTSTGLLCGGIISTMVLGLGPIVLAIYMAALAIVVELIDK